MANVTRHSRVCCARGNVSIILGVKSVRRILAQDHEWFPDWHDRNVCAGKRETSRRISRFCCGTTSRSLHSVRATHLPRAMLEIEINSSLPGVHVRVVRWWINTSPSLSPRERKITILLTRERDYCWPDFTSRDVIRADSHLGSRFS